jgi:hypothetical protein
MTTQYSAAITTDAYRCWTNDSAYGISEVDGEVFVLELRAI